MTRHIPNVTLHLMDGGVCLELAQMSLRDTLSQCSFDQVLITTPEDIRTDPSQEWVQIPYWKSNQQSELFVWYDLPEYMRCAHVLMTSWDAWVIDASLWDDEFRKYDYLGAPWWYDEFNVGHGLLRSKRLLQFLRRSKHTFPLDSPLRQQHPEDSLLSRVYRTRLEALGFKWPSNQVASRFMFECTRPAIDSRHFMFHDSFNFRYVLHDERLQERIEAMLRTPYLGEPRIEHNKTQEPQILPWLAKT